MKFSIIEKVLVFFRAKLKDRFELTKALHNISWLISDNVIRLLLGTFVGIWMARYLGPDQFGVYNYGIAYAALFSSLVTLGLDNVVVREVVKKKTDVLKIMGSTFFLKTVASIITVALAIVYSLFFTDKNFETKVIVIIFSSSLIFSAFDTIIFWFQAEVKSKFIVYAKTGSFVIISLLRCLALFFEQPLMVFVWLALLEVTFNAFGLLFVYRMNKQTMMFWKIDWIVMKGLLSNSWPLILSGLAIAVYMKIDQVMIGDILDDTQVGVYSVAAKLSETWYFIPMAIAGSVFPSIVMLRNTDIKLYLERIQVFYDMMAWLAICVAIPIAMFSTEIIQIIYGEKYAAAAPVLSVHVWSGIAVFLGVASEQYLLAENLTKISLFKTFFGSIINVVLNLYLIPKYGIIGAAWATLFSYSFSTVAVIFFKKSRRNIIFFLNTLNICRVYKSIKNFLK